MDIPGRIQDAAQRLRQGKRVNRITVRDFLRHFGVERRGAVKSQEIRTILDGLDIETEPDFESVWIDAPIWLRLKQDVAPEPLRDFTGLSDDGGSDEAEEIVLESTPSAVTQAEEQLEAAPISAEPDAALEISDGDIPSSSPTYRIGNLPAANKRLFFVNQDDSLIKAITLMLEHDISQLPVMQGEREVKGVVTWKSIGSKQALGCKCDWVRECREDARIVERNRTLFEAIPTIVDYGYVLVRDQRDRRITGIVTASDLSLQFQALSEPFLLLREIELHVRQLLKGKVGIQQFSLLDSKAYTSRSPQNLAELTFGEYIRLFQHPEIWQMLNLRIDAGVLIALLDDVRMIRNDVMHFDPDPMEPEDLNTLKRAVKFMQELHELLL